MHIWHICLAYEILSKCKNNDFWENGFLKAVKLLWLFLKWVKLLCLKDQHFLLIHMSCLKYRRGRQFSGMLNQYLFLFQLLCSPHRLKKQSGHLLCKPRLNLFPLLPCMLECSDAKCFVRFGVSSIKTFKLLILAVCFISIFTWKSCAEVCLLLA